MNTLGNPSLPTLAALPSRVLSRARPQIAAAGAGRPAFAARPASRGEARAADEVARLLDAVRGAVVVLRRPDGSVTRHGRAGDGRELTLTVDDWTVFGDVLARGDIGFGEAFVDGRWQADDLTALLTLLNRNRDTLRHALYGRWLPLFAERLRHAFNANSRQGSRRNIMAHYDLGNAFYQVWLDETMSYSSALFDDGARSLEDAQRAKYRRIVNCLGIRPGDRVLEIGCGWGGFAELAAREAGARVTGVTLSPAQLEFARERMRRQGLAGRVELHLCDYRDLAGRHPPFDHVVSIEMFEAVGEAWWPSYFRTLSRCLKPGGRALVQTITIHDHLFDNYRRGTDFIQRHVFPGGMLPSPAAFRAQARRAGLEVDDAFAFGFDYARTLALWQQAFDAHQGTIAGLGFDARFTRLWNFYLSYCQAGFATGSTDVMQFRLGRAG